MRHVTDGELHAYLDGALDHLPESRGEEIREHLSACDVCRERLEEERAIRDQARSLLETAAAGPGEVPAFEEIRKRSRLAEPATGTANATASTGDEETPRRRGPLKGLPVAWAATVILALGVGWMGGEIWRSLPQEARMPSPSSDAVGTTSPARRSAEEGGRGLDPEPAAGRARSAERDVEEEAPGVAEDEISPPVARAGREEGVGQEEAGEREAAEARGVEAMDNLILPATQAGAGPPAASSLQADMPVEPGAAPSPERSLKEIAPSQAWLHREETPGTGALPDPEVENSMTVPGLEVLSVDWEEWVPGERGLRVRQLLPMGDTLELRYLGLLMGSEPTDPAETKVWRETREGSALRPLSPKVLEASLPPGWNQVAMRWGRGWVVARAPLPEPSIRALLRSIE